MSPVVVELRLRTIANMTSANFAPAEVAQQVEGPVPKHSRPIVGQPEHSPPHFPCPSVLSVVENSSIILNHGKH